MYDLCQKIMINRLILVHTTHQMCVVIMMTGGAFINHQNRTIDQRNETMGQNRTKLINKWEIILYQKLPKKKH